VQFDGARQTIPDSNASSRHADSWAVRNTRLVVAVGAALVMLVTVLAFTLPPRLWSKPIKTGPTVSEADRIAARDANNNARNQLRDSGLKVAAGVAALAGALLALARLDLSRDERAQALLADARAEDAHRQDIYIKAVEQLGHSHPEVTLGGIYGLERLAAIAPASAWPRTVVEVLCAFVRQNPGGPSSSSDRPQPEPTLAAIEVLRRNSEA
jgi:hypothetical protein